MGVEVAFPSLVMGVLGSFSPSPKTSIRPLRPLRPAWCRPHPILLTLRGPLWVKPSLSRVLQGEQSLDTNRASRAPPLRTCRKDQTFEPPWTTSQVMILGIRNGNDRQETQSIPEPSAPHSQIQ